MRTLYSEGLMYKNLFAVEGELVENYNRALKAVTGKETKLTAFNVDKRGKSPEIQMELGKDYLQAGDAHRYMIVVSPDQQDAGIVDPEFSFDDDVISELYRNQVSGISVVTRVDGLYGELEDGLRSYNTIDDLLTLKWLKVQLHTPSGFITKSRELKHLIEQLEKDPNLITKDDSSHLKKMLELANEVGDIRGYAITNLNAAKTLGTFSSTLFGGTYLFRNPSNDMIKMKRPGSPIKRKRTSAQNKTCLISKESMESAPDVEYVAIDRVGDIVDFLLQQEYATLHPQLVENRLTELEDEMLLQSELDVANMTPQERSQALSQKRMPRTYDQMRRVKRQLDRGYSFEELLPELSVETIASLLACEEHKPVVPQLLTHLWGYDYKAMFDYNPTMLNKIFNGASKNKQDYIIKSLKR